MSKPLLLPVALLSFGALAAPLTGSSSKIPAAWQNRLFGEYSNATSMNERAGCGHPFTVTLDDSLLEDPWSRDDGSFQPGAICDSAVAAIATLCRDPNDDSEAFARQAIGENIQSIVCERTTQVRYNSQGPIPTLSLTDHVLHIGLFFPKDEQKPAYSGFLSKPVQAQLEDGDFLKSKGLNIKQARMRATATRIQSTSLERYKRDTELELQMEFTDQALIRAFELSPKRAANQAKAFPVPDDDDDLLGAVPALVSVLGSSCSTEAKASARKVCAKVKVLQIDTRKGPIASEFDPQTGRLTFFIDSIDAVIGEERKLPVKFVNVEAGDSMLELAMARALVKLGLNKADISGPAAFATPWKAGKLK